MRKRVHSIRFGVAVAISVIVCASALITAALGARSKHSVSPITLVSANFSALTSASTRLTSLPAGVVAPAPDLAPAPGAAHQLGHGAIAWPKNGGVCWTAGSIAGCVPDSPNAAQAIDPVVSDPDQTGAGQPARVSGLAVDSVARVTATLTNGSTLSTTPVSNWYEIDLPNNALPWSVKTIQAVLTDGQTITVTLPARAPAVG